MRDHHRLDGLLGPADAGHIQITGTVTLLDRAGHRSKGLSFHLGTGDTAALCPDGLGAHAYAGVLRRHLGPDRPL
jgi:hypothetical protein